MRLLWFIYCQSVTVGCNCFVFVFFVRILKPSCSCLLWFTNKEQLSHVHCLLVHNNIFVTIMTIFNVASVYWSIVHWVKCNFKKNHHNLKKGEDSWIWDAVNTKSELLMDNFLCFSFRIGCVHFLKAGHQTIMRGRVALLPSLTLT